MKRTTVNERLLKPARHGAKDARRAENKASRVETATRRVVEEKRKTSGGAKPRKADCPQVESLIAPTTRGPHTRLHGCII
jgi:hypothetical protein